MMAESWCLDFYDDHFANVYLDRGDVAATAGFIAEKAHLRKGDLVFDQCCGIGNISGALAAAGYRAIGVDLMPGYVARAETMRREGGLDCRFYQGDARGFVADEPCAAAFNWWTSFGYFDDDAENLKMLECAFRSLKEDGVFILDYMNREERLRSFSSAVPVAANPGVRGQWRSSHDAKRNMIVKSWTYRHNDGRLIEKKGGGAKLYGADDLSRMLKQAGFSTLSFYGSICGEPLVTSSPRCIVVAQK